MGFADGFSLLAITQIAGPGDGFPDGFSRSLPYCVWDFMKDFVE